MAKHGEWGNDNALLVQSVPHGTPKYITDFTTNDNDKSFPVPDGKVWDLSYVRGDMTASAVVGNRTLAVVITLPNNQHIHASLPTAPIAASASGGIMAGKSITTGTAPRRKLPSGGTNAVQVNDSLPINMLLPAGYIIRVYDYANIDGAGDNLMIALHVIEYDAALMEA